MNSCVDYIIFAMFREENSEKESNLSFASAASRKLAQYVWIHREK